MSKQERHKYIKKIVREYLSLRLVKTKPRKVYHYPDGYYIPIAFSGYGNIVIKYDENDDLDLIDSIIIHEFGHYIIDYKRRGLVQVSSPKRILKEEKDAWEYGESIFKKLNLLPPNFYNVKGYALKSYKNVNTNRKYQNYRRWSYQIRKKNSCGVD